MTRLFHVKPGARQIQSASAPLRHWAGVAVFYAALLGLQVEAGAAIYKCTGPDGKATFRDQPCTSGQSVTIKKEPAKAPTTAAKADAAAQPVDASSAARAAARERLRAAQTPECVDMGDRIQRFGQKGSGNQSGTDLNLLLERYEQQCAPRMREALGAENARAEAEARRQNAAQNLAEACAAKQRVLDERRPRLASLSQPDQRAFAVVESEVARDCR